MLLTHSAMHIPRTIIVAVLMIVSTNADVYSFDSRLQSSGYDLTDPIRIDAGDTLTINNCSENVAMQTFEFGIAPKKSGRHAWQINLTSVTDTLNLSLTKTDSNFGDIDHSEGIRLIVRRNNAEIFDRTFTDNVSTDSRPNYLRADIFPDGIDLSLGHNQLRLAARLPFASFYNKADITSFSEAFVIRRVIAHRPAPTIFRSEFNSLDDVNSAISHCKHPIAGIWEEFDESFDTESALIGGDYTIAIVPCAASDDGIPTPDADKKMRILYIGGGRINSKVWKPLFIKGTLNPTPFYSNFDLEWIDAVGNVISEGANAYVENNLLVIDFPLLNARIRFVRKH